MENIIFRKMFAAWALAYFFAFVFGIIFQYSSIKPMRDYVRALLPTYSITTTLLPMGTPAVAVRRKADVARISPIRRVCPMLSKKDFEEGLRAILIQNPFQTCKIDSSSQRGGFDYCMPLSCRVLVLNAPLWIGSAPV
jgi:hypothetical protein